MWLSRLPDPGKINPIGKVPSYKENILFTEKLDQRYTCPEHVTSLGVITVMKGNGRFGINRKQETLTKEKFLIINSSSCLSMDIDGDQTNPALLFFRSRLPDIVAASLNNSPEQLLDDPACNTHPVDFSILERLHSMNTGLKNKLLLLLELGGGSSSFAALKADSIVRSILEDIVIKNGLANKESVNIAVKKRATRVELYKRLYTAKEWIDANYDQSLTLDILSAIACMNSQHFLRSFKQLFLCTPHQYLINTRLENAKRMLVSGNDPVHIICRNTGLESLSSFSWLFKQRFGVSPSSFRKR